MIDEAKLRKALNGLCLRNFRGSIKAMAVALAFSYHRLRIFLNNSNVSLTITELNFIISKTTLTIEAILNNNN